MRIALASVNPTLGDFDRNVERALAAARIAADNGADLVVYPAFALCGTPIDGLANSEAFVADARAALAAFVAKTPVPALISTLAGRKDAASALELASMVARQQGYQPPQMDPGEFASGAEVFHVMTGGPSGNRSDGLGLCSWDSQAIGHIELAGTGVGVALNRGIDEHASLDDMDLLVAVMSQPYNGAVAAVDNGVGDPAFEDYCATAARTKRPVAFVNLLGGQDANVFDGRAALIGPDGHVLAQSPRLSEGVLVADVETGVGGFFELPGAWQPIDGPRSIRRGEQDLADYNAIVLASGDYVRKNGATDVVVGLSGGIDSTLVATVMVDALGAEHVHGVAMPGPYSSEGSLADAYDLAERLGISIVKVPITEMLEAAERSLGPALGGSLEGLARENTQARIRMLELYAFSNANGWMVINTGNKSEAAMGFSTLYGDTAGAYAPLGDLYKTRLYELARWRNSAAEQAGGKPPIPESVLTKAPSAELYPGQRDDQRLPAYDELDPVLFSHIEGGMSAGELVAAGFPRALVARVLPQVRRFEFKRRNEPMAPELSTMPLTSARAWPCTNAWADEAPESPAFDEAGGAGA